MRSKLLMALCCLPVLCIAIAGWQPVRAAIDIRPREASLRPSVPVLTVRDALDVALLNSPRASAVRAEIYVPHSQLWRALTLPNPAFEWDEANVEQTWRHGVNIRVEGPWSIVFRYLYARKQINQARVQIARDLWNLRAQVRLLYTNLIVNSDKAAALEEVYNIMRVLQEDSQKRYDLGQVAKLDVFRAQLQTQQARVSWQKTQRTAVQALEQLNIIMGKQPGEAINLPPLPKGLAHPADNFLLPDFSSPLPQERFFIDLSMRNKPDIKLVQAQIATAEANLRVAYGAIWPTNSFSFGQSKVQNNPGDFSRGWYTSGTVYVPIFNWNQGNIAQQRATIRQLRANLASQRNIVAADVAKAYRALWNERETLRIYEEHLLPESAHVVQLVHDSYKEGQTDATAVLQAQQNNLQIRTQYYAEVLAYQQAFTNLELATGTVLE